MSRLARYSYGIRRNVPWDRNNPNFEPRDKIRDPTHGEYLAANQMEWLVEKV
jgi:hypothetical protein